MFKIKASVYMVISVCLHIYTGLSPHPEHNAAHTLKVPEKYENVSEKVSTLWKIKVSATKKTVRSTRFI